jgi:hypothetical protein
MRKVLATMAVVLLVGAAHATTTYQYTGALYTTPNGVFTTSMRISGTFTTATPLPPNMLLTSIGPEGSNLVTAWSFSDGIDTFTKSNSLTLYGNPIYLDVATDASGNISAYSIGFQKPLPTNTVGQLMDAIAFANGSFNQATTQSPCVAITGNICTSIDVAGTGNVSETENGQFVTLSDTTTAVPLPALGWNPLIAMAVVLCAAGIVAVRRRGHDRV